MAPGFPGDDPELAPVKRQPHPADVTAANQIAMPPEDARYHQPMPDGSHTKATRPEIPKESPINEKPSSHKPSGLSQWLTYVVAVVAVAGLALAALAYFHPARNAASAIQQGGDAKANVCSAYASVKKAVVLNTHLRANPKDATAELAVAANARLALIGSGTYLRERLAANTKTPADLANAANSLANTTEQLGMNYLTDAGPDAQRPLQTDLTNTFAQIDKMCPNGS